FFRLTRPFHSVLFDDYERAHTRARSEAAILGIAAALSSDLRTFGCPLSGARPRLDLLGPTLPRTTRIGVRRRRRVGLLLAPEDRDPHSVLLLGAWVFRVFLEDLDLVADRVAVGRRAEAEPVAALGLGRGDAELFAVEVGDVDDGGVGEGEVELVLVEVAVEAKAAHFLFRRRASVREEG